MIYIKIWPITTALLIAIISSSIHVRFVDDATPGALFPSPTRPSSRFIGNIVIGTDSEKKSNSDSSSSEESSSSSKEEEQVISPTLAAGYEEALGNYRALVKEVGQASMLFFLGIQFQQRWALSFLASKIDREPNDLLQATCLLWPMIEKHLSVASLRPSNSTDLKVFFRHNLLEAMRLRRSPLVLRYFAENMLNLPLLAQAIWGKGMERWDLIGRELYQRNPGETSALLQAYFNLPINPTLSQHNYDLIILSLIPNCRATGFAGKRIAYADVIDSLALPPIIRSSLQSIRDVDRRNFFKNWFRQTHTVTERLAGTRKTCSPLLIEDILELRGGTTDEIVNEIIIGTILTDQRLANERHEKQPRFFTLTLLRHLPEEASTALTDYLIATLKSRPQATMEALLDGIVAQNWQHILRVNLLFAVIKYYGLPSGRFIKAERSKTSKIDPLLLIRLKAHYGIRKPTVFRDRRWLTDINDAGKFTPMTQPELDSFLKAYNFTSDTSVYSEGDPHEAARGLLNHRHKVTRGQSSIRIPTKKLMKWDEIRCICHKLLTILEKRRGAMVETYVKEKIFGLLGETQEEVFTKETMDSLVQKIRQLRFAWTNVLAALRAKGISQEGWKQLEAVMDQLNTLIEKPRDVPVSPVADVNLTKIVKLLGEIGIPDSPFTREMETATEDTGGFYSVLADWFRPGQGRKRVTAGILQDNYQRLLSSLAKAKRAATRLRLISIAKSLLARKDGLPLRRLNRFRKGIGKRSEWEAFIYAMYIDPSILSHPNYIADDITLEHAVMFSMLTKVQSVGSGLGQKFDKTLLEKCHLSHAAFVKFFAGTWLDMVWNSSTGLEIIQP